MVGLIGLSVFAWLCIIWSEDHSVLFNLMRKYFIHKKFDFLKWIFWACIVILFLALVNAVLSFLRLKVGHVAFGIIWLVVGFLMLVLMGVFCKEVMRFTCESPIGCKDAANLVHEDLYPRRCDPKYLPSGQTCRKADMTNRWESSSPELRSLNPACCNVSNDLAVWPLYCLCIFGLLMLIGIAVAVAANFSLANFNSSYDDYYK